MATQTYAIIDGDVVVNVILLDDSTAFEPPEGHILVPAPVDASIGWKYSETEWAAPVDAAVPDEPIEDPAVTQAKMEGLQELIEVGISEATARRILGLPPV